MAILQPAMEFAVRANLGMPLDSILVDGFFLVFFGHPSYGRKLNQSGGEGGTWQKPFLRTRGDLTMGAL